MKSEPIKAPQENVVCERCGDFDVMEIAGKFLCAQCVALAGCGCAGDDSPGNRHMPD